MKAFLAILALCLAATNAAVMPASMDYEGILQDAFNQVKQLQLQAEQLLQQNYEQAALEPTLQVDAALEDIEALRADHQLCVAPVQDVLSEIVNNMFDDMSICEATTHADAGTITKDVLIVTAEVLLDAYELAKLYKKCEAYTNTALKASCYTKFSVKIGLFVNDLRKTITDMVNNSQNQFAAVLAAGETCNRNASESAVQQLQYVRSNVDACIAGH